MTSSVKEASSGIKPDGSRPGNKVVKDEVASTRLSSSSEGAVEYSEGEHTEKLYLNSVTEGAVQVKWYECMPWPADVQPWIPYDPEDGLIFYYDCERFWSIEDFFPPANQEQFYNCRQFKQLREDKFYDCRQSAQNSEPKPTKKIPKPTLEAYPSVLLIFSCLMLSMEVVGMALKRNGMVWSTVECSLFKQIRLLDPLWEWYKHILWPPPEKSNAKELHEARRKKLLLTALAIAVMKVENAAPDIEFGHNRVLKSIVRRAKGKHGTLLTAKLSSEGAQKIRDALSSLPAYLFQPGDSKNIIVDTGCSVIATGHKGDLIPGSIEPLAEPKPMDGIGGTLNATHTGKFRYEIMGDDSNIHVLEGMCYYVPNLPVTLFSPQEYFHQKHEEKLYGYSMKLQWDKTTLELGPNVTVTIPHDESTRLPKLRCFANALETAESLAMGYVIDEFNQNLTHLQKILLQLHWRMGHVGFQRLQWIGRHGWLGKVGERFGQSSVKAPKCAACQFGKQERNPEAGTTRKIDTD